MNIEREYELESVYQSIKFVALGNDSYSDRILFLCQLFCLLCSSIVFTLFFFVRFREIEIIFVIDNFELYGSIFFLLDMHFIDENITRLLIFIFQWILLIMSLVRFNACIIVIGLVIWIREFFNFFLTF